MTHLHILYFTNVLHINTCNLFIFSVLLNTNKINHENIIFSILFSSVLIFSSFVLLIYCSFNKWAYESSISDISCSTKSISGAILRFVLVYLSVWPTVIVELCPLPWLTPVYFGVRSKVWLFFICCLTLTSSAGDSNFMRTE